MSHAPAPHHHTILSFILASIVESGTQDQANHNMGDRTLMADSQISVR